MNLLLIVSAAAVANCCEITERTKDSKLLHFLTWVPKSHSGAASIILARLRFRDAKSSTIRSISREVITQLMYRGAYD